MTTLLVSSAGGHLAQLLSLLPRMQLAGDVVWVTPDSGLSRDLLAGSPHYTIPYIKARDWRGATRLLHTAHSIIRETGAERIISTGAAPAPPFFLAGWRYGLDLHYIETATRSNAPSLSGRLVAKLPTANLYTQYPHLVDDRWAFAGSIFDPFEFVPTRRQKPIHKIVVSLGTEGYDFRRAVERLLGVIPADAEVMWQTGVTDVSGLPIDAHEAVPARELQQAIAEADVFVSHSGTGSALTAFERGKRPLLIPREAAFGEHIDDHQSLTANELGRRGLAVVARVGELSTTHLHQAASGVVISDSQFRAFPLAGVPATHVELIDLRDKTTPVPQASNQQTQEIPTTKSGKP